MAKTMISARVEEKLNEDLEALAEATRRSKAFLIIEALESYVERQSWQMQQIDAAFEKADQKGEWISNEAVETWLMSWGTDNVLPAPKPDVHRLPGSK